MTVNAMYIFLHFIFILVLFIYMYVFFLNIFTCIIYIFLYILLLAFLLWFFNLLCISTFEQCHLEPWPIELLSLILLLSYVCRYFDNYLEGELVMFRHRTLPYEVRTFQRRCNGHAACHCAIAIRSGDDVILVDSCGPESTPKKRTPQIEVRLYLNGDLTPGTEIIQYDGGRTYKVSSVFFVSHLSWPSPCAGPAIILVIQYCRYCAISSIIWHFYTSFRFVAGLILLR